LFRINNSINMVTVKTEKTSAQAGKKQGFLEENGEGA
jgi:hypothetical protein